MVTISLNELKEYYISLNYKLENEGFFGNIELEHKKSKEAIRSLILLHMRYLREMNILLDETVIEVLNVVNKTEIYLADLF